MSMGLEEKRFVKMLKDEVVPKYTADLQEMSGAKLTYEPDWPSMENNLVALQNLEYQGMDRINSAFRGICGDDLGKEAVKESIKKIVLMNVDSADKKKISLSGGTLTIQCAWGADSDGYYVDTDIKTQVEKML